MTFRASGSHSSSAPGARSTPLAGAEPLSIGRTLPPPPPRGLQRTRTVAPRHDELRAGVDGSLEDGIIRGRADGDADNDRGGDRDDERDDSVEASLDVALAALPAAL